MADLSAVKEHMEVVGSDGKHVGTVDRVDGGRIKLTKKDSGPPGHQGHHHYLDGKHVAGVDGNKVKLSCSADEAMKAQQES